MKIRFDFCARLGFNVMWFVICMKMILFPEESEILEFFPSLWFKLVLGFDFCIRKSFINTVRLKLLKVVPG